MLAGLPGSGNGFMKVNWDDREKNLFRGLIKIGYDVDEMASASVPPPTGDLLTPEIRAKVEALKKKRRNP